MLPLTAFTHRKIVVLQRDTPVLQAARAMCDSGIGCLLVGDAEGRAAGIVTDRDFACRWAAGLGGKDVPIEQIMSSELITADETDSLSHVIDLMERHGIRRVPIVRLDEEGKRTFVGVVTLDDLLAAHEIDPSHLSRIVRRQIGRKIAYLVERAPATLRARRRSDAHRQQSLEQFYSHLAATTGLAPAELPKAVNFIIGALLMRVTYTTASHLLAQLPQLVRDPLLDLPPGPDRSFSSRRILQELSSRFHLNEEQARTLLHRVIYSLKAPMAFHAMEHIQAQLPEDFQPFFEPIAPAMPATAAAASAPPPPQSASPDPTRPPWPARQGFSNRAEAAQALGEKLASHRGRNPLVLGIPRGAVPMARIIADSLGGELDVVLVHKIPAPGNPEFAVGSVSEFGALYKSDAVELYDIPADYIEETARREFAKLRDRRKALSPVRPPIDPKGRLVIIVDDGIATGSTMLAAIRALRALNAKRIVVAAPVAAPGALSSLSRECDELVVLESPENFFSISQFYDDFPQVTDAEVLRALSGAAKGKKKGAA